MQSKIAARKTKKPIKKLIDFHFILRDSIPHQKALYEYIEANRRHRTFAQQIHEMLHEYVAAQHSPRELE